MALGYTHQDIRVLKVVAPEGSDGLLTTDVPHVHLEAVLDHAFDVEPLGGHNLCCVRAKTNIRSWSEERTERCYARR